MGLPVIDGGHLATRLTLTGTAGPTLPSCTGPNWPTSQVSAPTASRESPQLDALGVGFIVGGVIDILAISALTQALSTE